MLHHKKQIFKRSILGENNLHNLGIKNEVICEDV